MICRIIGHDLKRWSEWTDRCQRCGDFLQVDSDRYLDHVTGSASLVGIAQNCWHAGPGALLQWSRCPVCRIWWGRHRSWCGRRDIKPF